MSKARDFAKFRDRCLRQLVTDRSLSAGALRVGIELAQYLNHETRMAWPGYGKLKKNLGVDRSTVIRGVNALEERGHIHVTRRRTGRLNKSNRYEFVIKPLSEDDNETGLANDGGRLAGRLC